MPTLERAGKDKAVTTTWRRRSGCRSGSTHTARSMIVRGDDLDALKALLPRYEGKGKCVYIDMFLQTLIQSRGIIKKYAFAA